MMLLISGVTCLFFMNKSSPILNQIWFLNNTFSQSTEVVYQGPPRLWRRPQKVKEAFNHAWSWYKNFAMRFDELVLVSKRSTDVLGGLDATIIDALDTSMIMRKMA
jgi:Glycosyl hydrolase family 47